MSTTSFDNFAEYYDEVMGNSGDYTHQHTIDPALFQAIGNVRGKVIYDIGSGNGYIPRKLHKMGAKEIWASDISSKLINIAKNRYPIYRIKYLVQNGSNFKDIPNNYFDLITMNMAIHYIKNLKRFFKGVNKSLKKDGIFAFTKDHPYKSLSHLDVKRINNIEGVLKSARKYLKTKKTVVYNHWTKKKDLVIYNRPISVYIEAMSENGLLVNKLIEPKTRALKSYKTREKVETDIPSIIAIGATKTR